jgi:hypothetical protein
MVTNSGGGGTSSFYGIVTSIDDSAFAVALLGNLSVDELVC